MLFCFSQLLVIRVNFPSYAYISCSFQVVVILSSHLISASRSSKSAHITISLDSMAIAIFFSLFYKMPNPTHIYYVILIVLLYFICHLFIIVISTWPLTHCLVVHIRHPPPPPDPLESTCRPVIFYAFVKSWFYFKQPFGFKIIKRLVGNLVLVILNGSKYFKQTNLSSLSHNISKSCSKLKKLVEKWKIYTFS